MVRLCMPTMMDVMCTLTVRSSMVGDQGKVGMKMMRMLYRIRDQLGLGTRMLRMEEW